MEADTGLEGEGMEGFTDGDRGIASVGLEGKRVGEVVGVKGRGLEEAEESEGVVRRWGGGEGSDEGGPGEEGGGSGRMRRRKGGRWWRLVRGTGR